MMRSWREWLHSFSNLAPAVINALLNQNDDTSMLVSTLCQQLLWLFLNRYNSLS